MKKIILSLVCICLFTGCESFLDTDNLMKKDTSNFPKTQKDAEQELTGCYSCVSLPMRDAGQSLFVISELLSDDRLGGGGDDDRRAQAINQLKKVNDNMLPDPWAVGYIGVFRCNMLLETIDLVKNWSDESQKKRIEGETHFLRGCFYFDLCRIYGTVPLVVTTEAVNNPRATPDELYALITSDLKAAIENIPDIKFGASDALALGHATKWAAEALMARVFLFYTGYYKKEALPLMDGSTVTKQEVIAWLDDCIQNSGHDLINDFRALWPYGNELTAPEYNYAKVNNVEWIGESGANKETIFAMKFSSTASWDITYYANGLNLAFSLRGQDYEKTFPFGEGYGFAPVNSRMWDEWKSIEPKDIRREASILDVNSPVENIEFTWNGDRQMEETGYWQKKYIAINAHKDGVLANYSYFMYNGSQEIILNNTQDLVLIRFADVLLMAAELKKDASYINRVRHRVGLDDIPTYTDQALRNERRWELAFEGVRYYDLLRWGTAGEMLNNQNGVEVTSLGMKTTMDVGNIAKRVQETGGFMPIPQTQIDLSNGVLEQSPGWSGNDILYK